MGVSWGAILDPPEIQIHVYMFMDLRGSKMALQETPIKYGGIAPSREPFWLYTHKTKGAMEGAKGATVAWLPLGPI